MLNIGNLTKNEWTDTFWYVLPMGGVKPMRLLEKMILSQYFLQIESLKCQFKSSFLELNIAKTKELVFGKGKAGNTPTPIYIDNQGVDIVSSFKYLGTLIDTNKKNCDHIDDVGQ